MGSKSTKAISVSKVSPDPKNKTQDIHAGITTTKYWDNDEHSPKGIVIPAIDFSQNLNEVLLFGFIRDHENINSLFVPLEIQNLCILFYGDLETTEIKLMSHSHRNKSNYYHHPPTHLLDLYPYSIYDASIYCSEPNNKFFAYENDWIIFKYQPLSSKIYIPRKFILTLDEKKLSQGIKQMNIFIGNADKNQWYQFKPYSINIKLIKEPQTIWIGGVDVEIAKELRFIKIEFINNHGNRRPTASKFVCKHFSLYGNECSTYNT